MKLLIVAADPMEFRGILTHAAEARRADVAVDWARSARLGAHTVLLAANGAGPKRASAAVDAALRAFAAEAIVSTGFCGALCTEFGIAEIVVGSEVWAGERRFTTTKLSSMRPHHTGVVCSIAHVAQTADEKRRLRAGGASAVEMEAGAVGERAAERGLGFYCIRAISDLAGEDKANDFNQALLPDGHFATMDILVRTLQDPLVRLPELIRLRNRCVRAARELGDFVADCRF
jgi:adenosylhomocysteine nucleosidase